MKLFLCKLWHFSGGNPSCGNMFIIVCFIDHVVEKGLCLLLASSSPALCYSIHVSNTRVQPSNPMRTLELVQPFLPHLNFEVFWVFLLVN